MKKNLSQILSDPIVFLLVISASVELIALAWGLTAPEGSCNLDPLDIYSWGHYFVPLTIAAIAYKITKNRIYSMFLPVVLEVCWEFFERLLETDFYEMACESRINILTDISLAIIAAVSAMVIFRKYDQKPKGRTHP